MSSSMFDLTVPVLNRALSNLKGVLSKGIAHMQEQGLQDSELLDLRLAEDMLPLASQIRIACDMSKGCVHRLTGQTPPGMEDNETSFAELLQRIDTVQNMLSEFGPEQLDGTEDATVIIKTPFGEISFAGRDYVQFFVYPNLFFHCTTAYNILRHQGVALGKLDFLGGRPA